MRVRVDQRITGYLWGARYPRRVSEKTPPTIKPVVLSGGSGTRLWPLSTASVPKQFATLIDQRSLFGLTLTRLDAEPPIVVTSEAHLDLVRKTASIENVTLGKVITEPVARNTAPAAIAAALVADPEDVLVILPSDHLIGDVMAFTKAINTAAEYASDGIVAFGVKPRRPETGYGYIKVGERLDTAARIDQFLEKPDLVRARELVDGGGHLWNSGIFVTSPSFLIDEASRLDPRLVDGVRTALGERSGDVVALGESFGDVESISLDHAIMEKTSNGLVMPLDVGWDDLGSYQSLLAAVGRDDDGNHTDGDVILRDVTGSYVRATSRRVAVVGLSDVVVVETPDGVLVIPLDRSQEVRDLQ